MQSPHRPFISSASNYLEKCMQNNLHQYSNKNITRQERKAIQCLQTNKGINLKQAFRSGFIIIMDRRKYILEAENQLNDQRFYKHSPMIPLKVSCQNSTL